MQGLAAVLGCPARFVGFRKDVPDWLTAADLAVVPSHVEPLGNATLEAMACGLPVVGSEVGGIPEMVVHEETGLLVPPRDAGAAGRGPGPVARPTRHCGLRSGRRGRRALRGTVQPPGARRRGARRIRRSSPAARGGRGRRRMSTLLVTEVFPPTIGGSGRWFWEVYRRLPRREVLIAAGVDPRQEEFDRSHDLRVVRMPLRIRPPGLLDPRAWRGTAGPCGGCGGSSRPSGSRRSTAAAACPRG